MAKGWERFLSLILQADDFCKPEEYGKRLNISLKSVYNYLSELDPYLKEYDLKTVRKSGKAFISRETERRKTNY